MFKIALDNFRCFRGAHSIPIRPITVVVGENSTGKSAILSSAFALQSYAFPMDVFFTPIGKATSWEEAASKTKSGYAKKFGLGIEIVRDKRTYSALAEYHRREGKPKLATVLLESPSGTLRGITNDDDIEIEIAFSGNRRFKPVSMRCSLSPEFTAQRGRKKRAVTFYDVIYGHDLSGIIGTEPTKKKQAALREVIFECTRPLYPLRSRVQPELVAPIRSKPKRFYDVDGDVYGLDGADAPYTLKRLLESASNRESKKILDAIYKYGAESGLFEKLDAQDLGSPDYDPFRFNIVINGITYNLIDVGYGVSQILPVLVKSVQSSNQNHVLVHQPEVHLHPRAQAAFANFAVSVWKNFKSAFLIETHSEYLVDRLRMLIRDGLIPSSDVQLIYLERVAAKTIPHVIEIDGAGAIKNSPPSYREFFRKETLSRLGV